MNTGRVLCLILVSILGLSAHGTGLDYHTDRLRVMESDELRSIVFKKFEEAQSIKSKTMLRTEEDSPSLQESGFIEAEELMADVLRIVWARPDTDGVRRQITEKVQIELSLTNSFPKVVAQVAGSAVGILQSPGSAVRDQETSYFILRNLIAEIRPTLKNSEPLKRVVEMIRDRDIKLSQGLLSHLELSSMQRGRSPSELARNVLKEL